MSDFNSSLPVRTELPGDVIVKVADATIPSQQLTVNPDGSVNITDNAGSLTVDATDLDIRDLVFATDKVDVTGSEVSLDAATLAALESITVQNGAGAAAVNIQDGGNSITVDAVDLDIRDLVFATDKVDVSGSAVTAVVTATDLDIRDLTHVSDSVKVGDGTDFLAVNTDGSINVVIQEDTGVETVNFNQAVAIAAGATSNHDLVFASASKLYQVLGAASGKMKVTVQIETGAATNVFNTIAVRFNSTATPDCDMTLSKYAAIPAGARVRVIRQNNDNQAQDLYSTIVGILG